MHIIQMPEDYALVLQQVDEIGEENFTTLTESLCLDSARLSHIVRSLKNKGLVKISHTAQGTLISLSSKGRRLIETIWPEAHAMYSY